MTLQPLNGDELDSIRGGQTGSVTKQELQQMAERQLAVWKGRFVERAVASGAKQAESYLSAEQAETRLRFGVIPFLMELAPDRAEGCEQLRTVLRFCQAYWDGMREVITEGAIRSRSETQMLVELRRHFQLLRQEIRSCFRAGNVYPVIERLPHAPLGRERIWNACVAQISNGWDAAKGMFNSPRDRDICWRELRKVLQKCRSTLEATAPDPVTSIEQLATFKAQVDRFVMQHMQVVVLETMESVPQWPTVVQGVQMAINNVLLGVHAHLEARPLPDKLPPQIFSPDRVPEEVEVVRGMEIQGETKGYAINLPAGDNMTDFAGATTLENELFDEGELQRANIMEEVRKALVAGHRKAMPNAETCDRSPVAVAWAESFERSFLGLIGTLPPPRAASVEDLRDLHAFCNAYLDEAEAWLTEPTTASEPAELALIRNIRITLNEQFRRHKLSLSKATVPAETPPSPARSIGRDALKQAVTRSLSNAHTRINLRYQDNMPVRRGFGVGFQGMMTLILTRIDMGMPDAITSVDQLSWLKMTIDRVGMMHEQLRGSGPDFAENAHIIRTTLQSELDYVIAVAHAHLRGRPANSVTKPADVADVQFVDTVPSVITRTGMKAGLRRGLMNAVATLRREESALPGGTLAGRTAAQRLTSYLEVQPIEFIESRTPATSTSAADIADVREFVVRYAGYMTEHARKQTMPILEEVRLLELLHAEWQLVLGTDVDGGGEVPPPARAIPFEDAKQAMLAALDAVLVRAGMIYARRPSSLSTFRGAFPQFRRHVSDECDVSCPRPVAGLHDLAPLKALADTLVYSYGKEYVYGRPSATDEAKIMTAFRTELDRVLIAMHEYMRGGGTEGELLETIRKGAPPPPPAVQRKPEAPEDRWLTSAQVHAGVQGAVRSSESAVLKEFPKAPGGRPNNPKNVKRAKAKELLNVAFAGVPLMLAACPETVSNVDDVQFVEQLAGNLTARGVAWLNCRELDTTEREKVRVAVQRSVTAWVADLRQRLTVNTDTRPHHISRDQMDWVWGAMETNLAEYARRGGAEGSPEWGIVQAFVRDVRGFLFLMPDEARDWNDLSPLLAWMALLERRTQRELRGRHGNDAEIARDTIDALMTAVVREQPKRVVLKGRQPDMTELRRIGSRPPEFAEGKVARDDLVELFRLFHEHLWTDEARAKVEQFFRRQGDGRLLQSYIGHVQTLHAACDLRNLPRHCTAEDFRGRTLGTRLAMLQFKTAVDALAVLVEPERGPVQELTEEMVSTFDAYEQAIGVLFGAHATHRRDSSTEPALSRWDIHAIGQRTMNQTQQPDWQGLQPVLQSAPGRRFQRHREEFRERQGRATDDLGYGPISYERYLAFQEEVHVILREFLLGLTDLPAKERCHIAWYYLTLGNDTERAILACFPPEVREQAHTVDVPVPTSISREEVGRLVDILTDEFQELDLNAEIPRLQAHPRWEEIPSLMSELNDRLGDMFGALPDVFTDWSQVNAYIIAVRVVVRDFSERMRAIDPSAADAFWRQYDQAMMGMQEELLRRCAIPGSVRPADAPTTVRLHTSIPLTDLKARMARAISRSNVLSLAEEATRSDTSFHGRMQQFERQQDDLYARTPDPIRCTAELDAFIREYERLVLATIGTRIQEVPFMILGQGFRRMICILQDSLSRDCALPAHRPVIPVITLPDFGTTAAPADEKKDEQAPARKRERKGKPVSTALVSVHPPESDTGYIEPPRETPADFLRRHFCRMADRGMREFLSQAGPAVRASGRWRQTAEWAQRSHAAFRALLRGCVDALQGAGAGPIDYDALRNDVVVAIEGYAPEAAPLPEAQASFHDHVIQPIYAALALSDDAVAFFDQTLHTTVYDHRSVTDNEIRAALMPETPEVDPLTAAAERVKAGYVRGLVMSMAEGIRRAPEALGDRTAYAVDVSDFSFEWIGEIRAAVSDAIDAYVLTQPAGAGEERLARAFGESRQRALFARVSGAVEARLHALSGGADLRETFACMRRGVTVDPAVDAEGADNESLHAYLVAEVLGGREPGIPLFGRERAGIEQLCLAVLVSGRDVETQLMAALEQVVALARTCNDACHAGLPVRSADALWPAMLEAAQEIARSLPAQGAESELDRQSLPHVVELRRQVDLNREWMNRWPGRRAGDDLLGFGMLRRWQENAERFLDRVRLFGRAVGCSYEEAKLDADSVTEAREKGVVFIEEAQEGGTRRRDVLKVDKRKVRAYLDERARGERQLRGTGTESDMPSVPEPVRDVMSRLGGIGEEMIRLESQLREGGDDRSVRAEELDAAIVEDRRRHGEFVALAAEAERALAGHAEWIAAAPRAAATLVARAAALRQVLQAQWDVLRADAASAEAAEGRAESQLREMSGRRGLASAVLEQASLRLEEAQGLHLEAIVRRDDAPHPRLIAQLDEILARTPGHVEGICDMPSDSPIPPLDADAVAAAADLDAEARRFWGVCEDLRLALEERREYGGLVTELAGRIEANQGELGSIRAAAGVRTRTRRRLEQLQRVLEAVQAVLPESES